MSLKQKLRILLGAEPEEEDDDDTEIMWRSVDTWALEDDSAYVIQQMVGIEDGVVKPYDAHRTIHIDAARSPGSVEDYPDEWTESQERWQEADD